MKHNSAVQVVGRYSHSMPRPNQAQAVKVRPAHPRMAMQTTRYPSRVARRHLPKQNDLCPCWLKNGQ